MANGCREDDFVAQLYGTNHEDSHIDGCADMGAHLEALQLGCERLRLPELPVSEDFLARQRQAIYRRLEQRRLWNRLQAAPSLAALLLALVILVLFRLGIQPRETSVFSDNAIFEDVFRIAAGTEPAAVEPMRSLFEVQQ